MEKLEKELTKALNIDDKFLRFFKNQKTKFLEDKIIDVSNTTYQIDLKTMIENEVVGFRYMLVLVNITNNHVYTAAMENKSAEKTLECFKRILQKYKFRIKNLECDDGSEFKGVFSTYCRENDIKITVYNLYHKNSLSIVERMVSTISKPLLQYIGTYTLKQKNTRQGVRSYNNDWPSLMIKVTNIVNQYYDKKFPAGTKWTMQDIKDQSILIDKKNALLKLGSKVFIKRKHVINIVDGKKMYPLTRHDTQRYDERPHTITDYLVKSGRIVRYFLDNNLTISYSRAELLIDK